MHLIFCQFMHSIFCHFGSLKPDIQKDIVPPQTFCIGTTVKRRKNKGHINCEFVTPNQLFRMSKR
jgi:hypothetical protein